MPRPTKTKPERALDLYAEMDTDQRAMFAAMCRAYDKAMRPETPKPRKPRTVAAPETA